MLLSVDPYRKIWISSMKSLMRKSTTIFCFERHLKNLERLEEFESREFLFVVCKTQRTNLLWILLKFHGV